MAVITGAIIGAVGLGLTALSMSSSNKRANEANELAQENMAAQGAIATQQVAFQKEQQAKLNIQKAKYASMKFKNPYAKTQTEFENVFEDLTVNQKQAQFEKDMFQQSQANVLQGLRGAAGGSGIAGLAQSLANQGQRASQQASASIGQQESRNQMATAEGAANVQRMETAGEMAVMGGEATLQQAEMSRQATLLGVEMGGMAGANAGVQSAYANQMAASNAAVGALSAQSAGQAQMAGSMLGATTSMVGSLAKVPGTETLPVGSENPQNYAYPQ
tara:strand:- start:131 stop:955 length:825 start_codon:yes stop_codon:yes gene_type:complete